MANRLANVRVERRDNRRDGFDAPEDPDPSSRLTAALSWIRARQIRDSIFEQTAFSDPAWDLLLNLYVGRCRQRRISVSDLNASCNCPPTTILRWIASLEQNGLLERAVDRHDMRRRYISLTSAGGAKMDLVLDHVAAREARAKWLRR